MNKKEKREWTIEGLTQLRNIMKYLIIQDNNIYIENPQNFIEALDDALEILKDYGNIDEDVIFQIENENVRKQLGEILSKIIVLQSLLEKE